MKYSATQNYINGKVTDASSGRKLDVVSPLDGSLLSTVPMSVSKDLDDAVKAAKAAFPAWSRMPIKERVQVFFRYKTLLEKNLQELAKLCSEENGKTYSESVAEIEKSIELTEFATSLPQLVTGEVLEVTGLADAISETQQHETVILLRTAVEGAHVNCTLEQGVTAKPGKGTVCIKGICSGIGQGDADLGLQADVYLTRCVIVNK